MSEEERKDNKSTRAQEHKDIRAQVGEGEKKCLNQDIRN